MYSLDTHPSADRPGGLRRRVRGRARRVAGARDQGRLLGRLHAHAHQPRQEEVVIHDEDDVERKRKLQIVSNCRQECKILKQAVSPAQLAFFYS